MIIYWALELKGLKDELKGGLKAKKETVPFYLRPVKRVEQYEMTTPKKHHYVPVWYLNKFTDLKTGMLSVYDIKKKEWREHKPSQMKAT